MDQITRHYHENKSLELQRWQETMQALDSAKQEKVLDGDTVHQWLQSWGTNEELQPPELRP